MLHTKFSKEEFGAANLGDKRLDKRLEKMASAAMRKPNWGFPRMMESDAELEATYRFFNNPRITPEKILKSHFQSSAKRCQEYSKLWILHDTTIFKFGGESHREGVGKVKGQAEGFHGHFSMAVVPDKSRDTLGLLDVSLINDTGRIGLRSPRERREAPDRQSKRWEDGVENSASRVGKNTSLVHVMDRECDSYPLWNWMVEQKHDFVIRVSWNRKVKTDNGLTKMFDLLNEKMDEPWLLHRTVRISKRGRPVGNPKYKKKFPARKSRVVALGIRAMPVAPKHNGYCGEKAADYLSLNIVHVQEINPPDGETPIEWHLMTTLPVDTEEQVSEIVDAYRGRWLIEEYFKALKTGCSFQKRQLESYHALTLSMAVLAPVAWKLLRLKTFHREAPDTPARKVLTAAQLIILKNIAKDPFPDNPTVQDAYYAIARLGGFLKHNKSPGWQTLGQGFEELLMIEIGWNLQKRSDQ
jgi:hypothetical protein